MAEVQPDLQTIVGTIQVPNNEDLQLVDALAQLPAPQSDLAAQRTWPHTPETGWVRIREPASDGRRDFRALIPRRLGASGSVPGKGIYLNGLWHPQLLLNERIPVTRWEVELTGPTGAIIVLNSAVGSGTVKWAGMADRLALAVVPKGRATHLPTGNQDLIVVSRGPHEKRRNARLQQVIPEDWPLKAGKPIVVVIAPMRRRLSRPGPGMLFLSDRATRLTGGLWHHHSSAIQRGLLSAGVLSPDSWARALAANHLADAMTPGPSAAQTLSWLAWIPGIDSLLYDGSLPFTSEIMAEAWPSDPIRDDLLEFLENTTPPHAAGRMLSGLLGWEKMSALVDGISRGKAIDDAASAADVPIDLIAQWRTLPGPQNLTLQSRPMPNGGRTLNITRQAAPSAPAMPVEIRIDGVDRTWISDPGTDSTTIDLPSTPRRISLDPRGNIQQTRRDDDGWPPRWTPTFAGGVSELALGQTRPTASAHAWLRRRYGTRWVYGGHLRTNPVDLLSGRVSISRSLGPLLDRRTRAYRVWLSTGVSLLDPSYRPTDSGKTAFGSWVGASWDTRMGWPLPRNGHRLSAATGTGWVPHSNERWTALRLHSAGLLPLTPWAVLAGRATGGLSSGDVAHRQEDLGGSGAVQGLPIGRVVGHTSTVTSVEFRALPIRNASVPLPLAWGSTLQLSAGLDVGHIWSNQGHQQAVGWTAGIAGVADIVGARPTLGGIWVANTLTALTPELPATQWPQLYLRFSQPF